MPGECSRAASQSTIVLLQASLSVAPHLPEVPQVRHLYWRDCSIPASHRRGTAILLEYYGGRRPRRTRTGRGGEGDVALQKGRAIWMKQLQLRLYWLQLQCGIIKPDPPPNIMVNGVKCGEQLVHVVEENGSLKDIAHTLTLEVKPHQLDSLPRAPEQRFGAGEGFDGSQLRLHYGFGPRFYDGGWGCVTAP